MNFSKINEVSHAKLFNFFLSAGYFLGLVLLMAVFVNHGPHNLVLALFVFTGLFFIAISPLKSFKSYSKNRLFFSLVLIYLIHYLMVNFYHLGWGGDFKFALERVRWAVYILLLFPLVSQIVESEIYKRSSFKRLHHCIFGLIAVLLIVIISDSIHRAVFKGPLFLQLFSSKILENPIRASWTYNAIPFSQLSFFASLVCLVFAAKMRLVDLKVATLSWALSAGMFLTSILSQTRSTWLGVLVFGLCLTFLYKKSRKLVFVLAVIVLVPILFIENNFLKNRLISIGSRTSFSNRYRIEHWSANLKLSYNNLLIGVGYAQNKKPVVIDPYLSKFTDDSKMRYGHSHNEYIETLSGMGILSLLLYLGIFAVPLLSLLKKKSLDFAQSIGVSYLVFIYFVAMFDVINFISWTCLTITWFFCLLYESPLNEDNLRVQ